MIDPVSALAISESSAGDHNAIPNGKTLDMKRFEMEMSACLAFCDTVL